MGPKNLFNILGNRIVFCFNETLGGGHNNFLMRADHWKGMIRSLELLVLPPNSLEREEWLKIKLMINHAHVMTPS